MLQADRLKREALQVCTASQPAAHCTLRTKARTCRLGPARPRGLHRRPCLRSQWRSHPPGSQVAMHVEGICGCIAARRPSL
eukprot:358436-Chlamydomonas_euryale.AAC.7